MDGLKPVIVGKTAEAPAPAPTDVPKELHGNFTTWETVPPKHYEQWLMLMEPASMSKANLRPLTKLPKTDKITHFCRILERATGMDPQQLIGPDKSLVAIGEMLVALNLKSGRPLRDITFPIC